ncbi:MAG: ATP-binding protein [Bacteroidales bacterium]|nr:ATP-binding protein [Bacteroidales bacterium]
MFKTLTSKITIAVFSTYLLILATVIIVNYQLTNKNNISNTKNLILQKNCHIANVVDKNLLMLELSLKNLAGTWHQNSYEDLSESLQYFFAHQPSIKRLSIEPASNPLETISCSRINKDSIRIFRHDSMISLSALTIQPKDSAIFFWQEMFSNNQLIISAVLKFSNFQLRAEIDPIFIDRILTQLSIDGEINGFLVTQTGKVLSPLPQMSYHIYQDLDHFQQESGLEIIQKTSKIHYLESDVIFENSLIRKQDDEIVQCFLIPISTTHWKIGAFFTPEMNCNAINNNSLILILVAFLSLIGVTFFFRFLVRRLLRPILFLTNEMSRVSEQNLHLQVPLTLSHDEIGNLTRSCKILIERWNIALNDLENTQNVLKNANKTLETNVFNRTKQLLIKNEELQQSYQTIGTLSEIGREITSCLNISDILSNLYEEINKLMICDSFAIMTYDENRKILECKLCIENGERLPYFEFDLEDDSRLAVWCLKHRQKVFINCDADYDQYITHRAEPVIGKESHSIIYTPILQNDKLLGVISVQSYKDQSYTKVHVDMLETLASYTTVAIINATAFESLKTMNANLIRAQEQLVLSERMASLGNLTAGIAHEIKNPLNFINNFAALLIDLSNELNQIMNDTSIDETHREEIIYILSTMSLNASKILEHGNRANTIVKSMLLHARGQSGNFQKINLNKLLSESLILGYHGMRAQDSSFNVKIEEMYDENIPEIFVVPQNLSRVFLNLINNACYAVNEQKKYADTSYTPTITLTTKNLSDTVKITIRDNGKGILPENLNKVFSPFFTTKPAGKGTGLGLSISYGIIVEEHQGSIKVQSEVNKYTEFTIILPKKEQLPKNHE